MIKRLLVVSESLCWRRLPLALSFTSFRTNRPSDALLPNSRLPQVPGLSLVMESMEIAPPPKPT